MKRFKSNADKIPLHCKILLWFVLFSLIMLVLLWVFQTIFFGAFYKNVRINQVKACAESIKENITETNITSLVENVADYNDVQIYVYDTSTSVLMPLYSTDKSFMRIALLSSEEKSSSKKSSNKSNKNDGDDDASDSTSEYKQSILTFSEKQEIMGNSPYNYYETALSEDGSSLVLIEKTQDNKDVINSIKGDTPPMDKLNTDSMVYTTLCTDKKGNSYMLILTSQITPVDSVLTTIGYQLLTITFLLIGVGIILAIFASKKISKPITDTTRAAKELAKKNYDVEFDSYGYLEVTELNDTLDYAAKELKKVEVLQRELIANISHDLRTPLTMITGYSEVMRDLPGENTPENMQIIIDEANRLNMLVSDLLDISKLQSGATPLAREKFSLTNLIIEIFQRYNKLKEQDGYNLLFEYEQEVYVNADFSKINQVVYNLMNNAINYSGKDKTIVVRQLVKGNKVLIEVEDHGDGIDKEHLENIWDRYYKVDKEHRSSVVGTGLGLSIVKNILDLHSARYGVRSIVGKGSVFWFELEKTEKN